MAKRLLVSADSEEDTDNFAQRLAQNIEFGTVIHLRGDLGVGKTTLCRCLIHALGYQGRVKSPTYTLVEPYPLAQGMLYHFDLYRLSEPSELEYVGYRDYFNPDAICLVEWPEHGGGLLPQPELEIEIQMEGKLRKFHCTAKNAMGERLLKPLTDT